MEKLKELCRKYRSMILYVVFGVLTTLVNLGVYRLCYYAAGVPNVPSDIIAWLLAVAFAFITNKPLVFESRSFDRKTLAHEIPAFIGARVLTGLLDLLIMYVAVDVMHWNAMIWKLISNIVVIVLNYIASRMVIFRKGREHTADAGLRAADSVVMMQKKN